MSSFPDVELLERRGIEVVSVLLVSRSEEWVESVQPLLEGIDFARSASVAESVEIARSATLDLVISDLVLPDADCAELCRRLKDDPSTADVAILLAARFHIEDPAIKDVIEAGADDYFRLSVPPLLARKRIERLIAHARDRRKRREAESRYRTLIESLPEIVYSTEARPPYAATSLSHRAQSLGYLLEDWQRNPNLWIEIIHADDRRRVLGEMKTAEEERRPFEIEYRVIARDGRVRWIHDRGVLLLDEDGEPLSWHGLISDITHRKEAEEAVRRSEERYRAFVEQSSEAIWCFEFEEPLSIVLSEDEQISHAYKHAYLAECNDVMARMYGFNRAEEIIGARLADMLIPSEPANTEYLRAFINSGYRLLNAESHETDKEGRVKYFLNNLIGVVENGLVRRAWGIQRDVTESRLMEEALRESEKRFRLLIESSSDIITILTGDGIIRYESPSIERVLGYKPEELIEKNGFDFIHPDDIPRIVETIRTGLPVQRFSPPLEMRVLHKDGSWRVLEAVGTNMIDDPAISGLVITSRDITGRKRAEEALRLAQFTIDSAPDIIHYVDRYGRIVFANNAATSYLGYTNGELLAMNVWDIDITASEKDWPQKWDEFKKKGSLAFETRHRTKDGTIIPVDLICVFLEFKGIEYVCGFSRDIRERKQMEAAFKRSEREYRNLFENANDAILIFEPETEIILEANKKACETYGFARDELIGMSLKLLTRDVKGGEQRIREVLERGRAENFETIHFRKDGTPINILGGGTLIEYLGNPAVMTIARDITDVKKLQQQLIQADKLAALGQMIAGVAHELNNPLTSVMGFTQLILMETKLDAQVRENLEIVCREAERTRRIVQNLLSFSRQHKPARTEIDVNELMDHTLDLRAYEMSVNNITVERNYRPVPNIMADEHQIQQVFLNIIINAEQAMHSHRFGGVLTINTSFEKTDRGDFVKVVMADDGPGISTENLARLFDPFFTTKPVGKATGLGLSISYGIIREHGGTIRAESVPGQGAAFILELPLRPA